MALTGIDTSSYQSGLNVGSTAADVIFIKATEGTGYVNPSCDKHYQQAKNAGKLRAVYHFARNRSNSAVAEADYFLANVQGYLHDAVLALDWEDGSGVGDVNWAKAWLDHITEKTGIRPIIYMSASPASSYAWEPVTADYALWIAGYPTSAHRGLETPDCPYQPGHGWTILAWQYTSAGQVSGYSGNLDLNVIYADAATWAAYAGGNAPAPQPQPSATIDIRAIQAAVHASQDNVAGPDTRTRVSCVAQASKWGGVKFPLGVAYTQGVVGTTADGVWGANSRAAHDATVMAIQNALNGLGYGLAEDAVWGEHTETAVTDALNRADQP